MAPPSPSPAHRYATSKFFDTPLAAAALKYDTDPEAMKLLLEAGPEAVHKPKKIDPLIKTMFRVTSVFGAFGNVKFRGMNRMMGEVKSFQGMTPIHLASERGDFNMVKSMLAASPSPPVGLAATAPLPSEIAEKKFAPHLVTADAIKSIVNESGGMAPSVGMGTAGAVTAQAQQ
jgi:ankyrin repeat protein